MNFIWILLFLPFHEVLATEYCSDVLKCNGITNSGCDCNFGPNCQAPKEHTITDAIRNSLLVAHNKYREKVASNDEKRGGIQGGATKMYALQYDKELEYTATCWNKKCTFAHDQCRITEVFRPAGQNLYWSSGKGCSWNFNLNQATELWYDEVKDMTKECFEAYGIGCESSKVGHFTQMIWAETTHVGCSLVEYAGPTCQLACNYGPAGNFLKEEVFKCGVPASECDFKSKVYKHLCLLSSDQEEEDEKNIQERGIKDRDTGQPNMTIVRSSADVIRMNRQKFVFKFLMILSCFVLL
ncbi:venom allergen 5-like [Onthophagus taurus]|uniref:venom allergen 5-like n=1 Tax=Onthophagus taurus TaxID=166361 RepID=UPI0039BE7F55